MSLSRAQLRRMANGDSADRAIHRLMGDPQHVLATILLGNLFVNMLMTVLTAALFARLLAADGFVGGALVRWLGLEAGDSRWAHLSGVIASLLNIAVLTPLLILFGELSPKVKAYRNNLVIARRSAKPLLWVSRLLHPLLVLLGGTANCLQRLFGIKPDANSWNMLTTDEVAAAIDEAATSGGTNEREKELLERIMRFNSVDVKEIMVPRTQIAAINDDVTLEEAAKIFHQKTYSCAPVYHEDIDDIWGVVTFSDTLEWLNQAIGDMTLASFRKAVEASAYGKKQPGAEEVKLPLHAAEFVPASAKIDRLLAQMRSDRSNLRIVVSEYGGTLGLVTRDMILEEIVGRYACGGQDYNQLRTLPDGVLLADGRARLRTIADHLEIEIDSENDTLGGFIMEQLGKIPNPGDEVEFEGWLFRVVRTAGRIPSAIKIIQQTHTAETKEEENA
jgi:putative hemolysin